MYCRSGNSRKHEDRLEFRAFVQNSNVEEIIQLIQKNICKTDATKILDDILQAFSDSDACQLKRCKVVESTLKSLEKAKISAGQAIAIINRIVSDFSRYSKQHLLDLVDFCLANIRNNNDQLHSWKDLLPVLLESLENEKYISYNGAEISGSKYKSLIVKTICNNQWNVDFLPALAKMFGDMTLDKDNRHQVLKILCSASLNLPLDQLPSFVYQALKLCKDGDNQKLFAALSKYFDLYYSRAISTASKDGFEGIDVINIKEIQDTESTVLYHVYQAARLNHENMKDFIRFLKHVPYAPEYTLQPFTLAVLMSVSNIYEYQIFEVLKLAIINNSLEKEKRHSSAWLRKLLPSPCDIIGMIQQVIGSSNKDRHLVLRGLTGLAFTLMSTERKSKSNVTDTWSIGSEIMQEIIKKRHETVPVVLEELINKIIVGGIPMTHYTDCLKCMCRDLSMIVLDQQVLIMTILERLLFLPSVVASHVLNAIFPLIHVSSNIRENLFLTLRKALYRKGISKRQIAVTGFLKMLKYSKMHSRGSFRLSQRCSSSGHASGSGSRSTLTQVTLEYNSQREKSVAECDKTLCYEIVDILKKSFTYEFEVRLHLYEGLYDSVSKNPDVTEILLDMFLSHLNLYLHTDDNTLPPIKFELCTDIHGAEVVLQEPIAHLIFALQKIYTNTVTRNSNVFDKLYYTLESLCERMAATELEHLNLDHGDDLLHGDFPKSQIKVANLITSIGIYEALIAFRIGECSRGNKDSFHKIDDLYQAYTRLIDFVKSSQSTKLKKLDGDKAKRNKDIKNITSKKPVKSNNIKIPNTIMDFDVIRQGLSLLFSESLTENISVRQNRSFCRYMLQTCEQLIRRATSFEYQMQDSCFLNSYIEIGRLLYKYFVLNLNDALASDEQTSILALQCFKEISRCMCTSFAAELPKFLHSIFEVQSGKSSVSMNTNFQLQEIILSLKPSLIASLAEETDDEKRKKVPFLLLEIIQRFMYKINFENFNFHKMLEYGKQIIELENIQSSIVPTVVKFFLDLEQHTCEYGETMNEICLELCEQVGSIDGTELSTNRQYKVIREDTALQIYNKLNGQIKEKLINASWLLMRLKAEDAIARAPATIDEAWNNNLREKERNLCKELSYITQVLHTLTNISIQSGPSTNVTFQNLQYLYRLLGYLTKYFYAKSNGQNAAFQAVKFVQVVQLAGKPLKSAFYNLVTYIEENQNELHPKSDSYAQRKKILRETKVIPRVVFEIEQFNTEILLLGKRTGVPLENYVKHSVTRDFRIKNPQLVEGLEKMDVSLLTSPNVENSEDEIHTLNMDAIDNHSEEEAIPRKRARTED